MKTLVKKNNWLRPLKAGEIIEGKAINKGKSSLYLDLGAFGVGIIYGREFNDAKDILKSLKIGDTISAKVVEQENEEGYIELSISQAGRDLTWQKLRERKDSGEEITIKIFGANKGGLLTEISKIPAFLPLSQLSRANSPLTKGIDRLKIVKELQKFIGQDMQVKIFDIDPIKKQIILSEKDKENKEIKEALKNYKVGDVVNCEIAGVVDFGAFVKFGKENIDGLIHISELDWKQIENPGDIVSAGQKIDAKIINITNEKVFLSLKALKKDPWQDIENSHKKGDTIKAKVTKFNNFGAFVQLNPEIQGLCHISEFGSMAKMEDVLKIGQEYDFQILLIDTKEHRLNLKLVP